MVSQPLSFSSRAWTPQKRWLIAWVPSSGECSCVLEQMLTVCRRRIICFRRQECMPSSVQGDTWSGKALNGRIVRRSFQCFANKLFSRRREFLHWSIQYFRYLRFALEGKNILVEACNVSCAKHMLPQVGLCGSVWGAKFDGVLSWSCLQRVQGWLPEW